MFKNREFRIKLVKTPEAEATSPTILNDILNPDTQALINEHMKKWLRNVAITVVATAVAIKVVDTACDIAEDKLTN